MGQVFVEVGKNEIFEKYMKNFDLNEPMIKLKYDHTHRVVHVCREIIQSLNLNEEDCYLAETIAFFHDYARFPQWTQYKTFRDGESRDHADWAVELLFDNHEIEEYDIPTNYYKCIRLAIKNHNKFEIDCQEIKDSCTSLEEYERILMHCKIVRDADKVDIFETIKMRINPTISGNRPSEGYSSKVIASFKERSTIRNQDEKTDPDYGVRCLAFAFDTNYKKTKQIILERKYIDCIVEHFRPQLTQKDLKQFIEMAEETKDYLKQTLQSN